MSFEMNSVPISYICDRKHIEACHTSALHIISVRSVYIKKSSDSGSILANLNDTMQRKQYLKNTTRTKTNKQTYICIQIETRITS